MAHVCSTRRSMGSSSALCRKRSTPCILLACALAVSLDISSMQSFLVASAVCKPLSVLCRRGEKCMLRNSAKGAPGETISLDANRDVAVRHLEQWLLAEGREVDDTTVQALRDVPPELALTIIDGLWSAFTKRQNQEDVDANSLAVGQKLPGVIHFGGASINLGEALQLHIPALDLKASATIGQDQKMDVRVEEIQGDWKRGMAPNAPTLSVDAIRVGQQLCGVVKALPNFGGAFMGVGADHDVYLPAAVLAEGTQVGDEMDVWVRVIKADGKVTVTPIAPKVDISSLALGQKLHGVIESLPEFGGAFLDIGAVIDAYMPARALPDGAKAGDEIDVWVKEIKDGKAEVSPTVPKVDIRSLAVGDKLHGVITPLPKFGGAFVDIGAVINVYIPASDLTEEVKAGAEADVWVKRIGDDGKVQVTQQAPEAHDS
mmetsp:Transcript_177380/g.431482  ORF Transcript_177380/g.431482 Transcript_177380/m.431482 type:complete len:431 (+) Transcript_177380:79-1371(+)